MGILRDRPNKKRQGDVGLGFAIAWFMSNGYIVSVPLGELPYYDLIVDLDGTLYKVQVKTSYFEKYPDIYQVQLSTKGGNRSGTGKVKYFDPTKVDYVFALTDIGGM